MLPAKEPRPRRCAGWRCAGWAPWDRETDRCETGSPLAVDQRRPEAAWL